MEKDGRAGEELPGNEVGEICYHPPIVFLGYYNMQEETAKSIIENLRRQGKWDAS